MTTIACDGRSMAGDGMLTENDHVCHTDYEKVHRLRDGRLVGFSGDSFNWEPFRAWLDSGAQGDPPLVRSSFGCIVLCPDGGIYQYDADGRAFPEHAPVAIGSGTRFALAAMDFGRTAEEAVQYASLRDIYTGGEITVLHLEQDNGNQAARAAKRVLRPRDGRRANVRAARSRRRGTGAGT